METIASIPVLGSSLDVVIVSVRAAKSRARGVFDGSSKPASCEKPGRDG